MHLSYSFIFLLLIFFMLEAKTQAQGKSTLVSAIFMFGDSTADPGNNSYQLTPLKSNFKPYGRDFPNHVATGRFTNGMLISDFIENVISLSKQLENFKEYQKKMEAAIGKEQTKNLIKEALFIVSAGTNDFVVNYNALPTRSKNYTLSAYTDFLLQHVQDFLQELLDQGARKIAVVGPPPMGCLPIVITLKSDYAFTNRDCIDFYSSIASDYNFKIQNQQNAMQIRYANLGSRIAYMDIYAPLEDVILGRKYDFEEVNRGCCETGLLELAYLCNPISYACPNASNEKAHLFWDSIHPNEKAYYLVSRALQPTFDSITKY